MDSNNEVQEKANHDVTTTPSKEEPEAAAGSEIFEEAMLDSDLKKHMEDWKKVAQERPLRVMVCGLGGVGKFTLINHLLQLKDNEKWAEEGRRGGVTTYRLFRNMRGPQNVESKSVSLIRQASIC